MIHNDIQNQLQLLIKTSAPPLIEVAEHAVGTPQWTPGQQIPAHVLASLPNGRFQVQVGDQILDLNLPRNTQPGETLELTYVSNTPRLTFALVRDLPGPAVAMPSVSLSDTARVIGTLLQGGAPAQASNTVHGGTAFPRPVVDQGSALLPSVARTAPPVLVTPPDDVPAFAQALRASLSQSGLFYESHQVQWLNGERNLASLRQEPQGQLSPMPQQDAAKPPMSAPQPLPHGEDSLMPATQPLPGVSEKGAAGPAIHPQTLPLVQQQLQALDTRQVIWQGEVWPGQQMSWEIEEQTARRDARQDEEPEIWHTRLNLQLPTLGGVNVKLAFVNGAVHLDISADADASALLMRQNQPGLDQRFKAAGLPLAGVTIQQRHG